MQAQRKNQAKNQGDINAGRVEINFYTDPLCCWSWAFEQHWQRLLENYSDRISFRYIMCGMIPDWNSYSDPMNSVSRPLQMGPVWMHAAQVTGVKMKYDIWHRDPPASSYPACIAVKTAELQSREAAHRYLNNVRRALMEEGLNIAKPEVLLDVAMEMSGDELDFETFSADWRAGNGKAPFKADLQQARFNNIGRYPTLTFKNSSGKGVMTVGYRPYENLEQAFHQALE